MIITPWEKIGEAETVACGYGKRLDRQWFKNHHSEKKEFFFIEGVPWSVVLAITKDSKVIMVRLFKQGRGAIIEEVPGGSMETGEDPESVVRRELQEETGYVAGRLISLGQFWLDPRSSRTIGSVFLADNCVFTSALNLDHDEQIEVFLLSLGEYVKRILVSRADYRTEALVLIRAFPYLGFSNQCRVVWVFVCRMILSSFMNRQI